MFGVLLTLLILDGLLLMVIVLLQAGKGGGLAAMGGGGMGTDTLVGGRQAATILTKSTWITGGIFLVLALVLSIMSSSNQQQPESVLEGEFQEQVPTNPEPVLPGAGDVPPAGDAGAGDAGGEPITEPPESP
ncbi:MAG: preprotein translocase subunit SecG [Gemmatimonadota bacterium]